MQLGAKTMTCGLCVHAAIVLLVLITSFVVAIRVEVHNPVLLVMQRFIHDADLFSIDTLASSWPNSSGAFRASPLFGVLGSTRS